MKVTIINSPLFRESVLLYDEDSLPPIGLGYIATYLQENGIDVELIDGVEQRIPLNELIIILTEKKTNFICLNIFTTNYDLVKDLVESISFTTHFIIGGLSTKELHKLIVKWETNNKVDIVIGDGELITLDIIRNDLKELPILVREQFRVFKADGFSCYFIKDISKVSLNRNFFKNEPVKHSLGFIEANIVTSRGCIYNCTFCAAARSLNKESAIREMNADAILKELQNISQQFPSVTSIRVLDDLFLKSNKNIQTAINVFSHFHFKWRAMAHVNTFRNIESSVMIALKKSGCFELFTGIESGSPVILKSINKTHQVEIIIANLKKVMKAGIHIKGYFIYGFPDETIEDMDMTFHLASRIKAMAKDCGVNFRTSVFQFRPYHATEIYGQLQAKGIDVSSIHHVLPNDELSALVGRRQFNFHSGNYSKVDINRVHDYIYRTINLNGGDIFSQITPNSTTM